MGTNKQRRTITKTLIIVAVINDNGFTGIFECNLYSKKITKADTIDVYNLTDPSRK